MSLTADFDIKLQEIKLKLGEFIQEHASKVKVKGNGDIYCQCISPEHPDNNPSMYIGSNIPYLVHCFSCGVTYNIFQANNIFTGAPLYGLPFIEKNANQLAIKYGIEPIDITQLDETVLAKFRAQNIHDVASEIIGNPKNPRYSSLVINDYALKVGISEDVAKLMRVGTVTNVKSFLDTIKAIGNWSTQDLEEAGIRSWLFGPEKITYTIFNNYGVPVAFAARNLDFDGRFGVTKNPKQDRKWINSGVSIIYDKSECLYGIHVARKQSTNKVYIFEGYTDVCVAYSHGIKNAVCIGGTGFSPAHVKMLADAEFGIAIIALDNDKAGCNAVDSVLEKGFSEVQSIKPHVLLVPETLKNDGSGEKDTDPDSYIKLFGPEAFMALKPKNAFRYTLDRMPDQLDNADQKTAFMAKFMPIIMNETSAITQEEMRKDIARRIGVSVELVKESQYRTEQQKDQKNREQIKRVFKKFSKNITDALDLYPEKVLPVVSEFKEYVDSVMDADKNTMFSKQEVVDGLTEWWDSIQKNSIDSMFWKTGWPFWDNTIGGIKKQGNFTGITGAANTGKSAFLMNMAVGILMDKHNDHDEMLMLYWTIDDPREDLLTKMVAIMTKHSISQVSNYSNLGTKSKTEIREAYAKLRKWIEKERCLSIKDMGMGSTADDLTKWVEQEMAKQPTKKPLVIIDNFANMTAATGDDMATQIININKLHKLRASNNLAIVSSFEVNKEGTDTRAGAKSVYGSGKITYRLTMNLSLFNEVDMIRTQNLEEKIPRQYWLDNDKAYRPVLELALIKTKMTFRDPAFRSKIFFRFVNHVGVINEIGCSGRYEEFKKHNAGKLYTEYNTWTWDSSVVPAKNPEDDKNKEDSKSGETQSEGTPEQKLTEPKDQENSVKAQDNF